MKDGQSFRVKVINGPDDLPKDKLKQYHCFTKTGEYYFLYGNTFRNNSYPIDWYLDPIEPITNADIEVWAEKRYNKWLSGGDGEWIELLLIGAKAGLNNEIKHIEK